MYVFEVDEGDALTTILVVLNAKVFTTALLSQCVFLGSQNRIVIRINCVNALSRGCVPHMGEMKNALTTLI